MEYIDIHDLEQSYWNSERFDDLLKALGTIVDGLVDIHGFCYEFDTKCQNTCDPWRYLPEDQQTDGIKMAFCIIVKDFAAYVQNWEPCDP